MRTKGAKDKGPRKPRKQERVDKKLVMKLLSTEPITFEQVGKLFGVSKQYIYQVYQKELEKEKNFERYKVLTVGRHRVGTCKICLGIIDILQKYEVLSRDALAKQLGIPKTKITAPHMGALKKVFPDLVKKALIFRSSRMAKAFVYYKESDIPIHRVGVVQGYHNFFSRIYRMGKKGIDITRNPRRKVKALLW